jgi:hypothetical protein
MNNVNTTANRLETANRLKTAKTNLKLATISSCQAFAVTTQYLGRRHPTCESIAAEKNSDAKFIAIGVAQAELDAALVANSIARLDEARVKAGM